MPDTIHSRINNTYYTEKINQEYLEEFYNQYEELWEYTSYDFDDKYKHFVPFLDTIRDTIMIYNSRISEVTPEHIETLRKKILDLRYNIHTYEKTTIWEDIKDFFKTKSI